MSKRNLKIIVCGLTVLFIVVVALYLLNNTVEADSIGGFKARFIYNDSSNISDVSNEDYEEIKNILNNKVMYSDNPSCGFDENISLQSNDGKHTFCVACDGCHTIYYSEQDKYFHLSDDEYGLLIGILSEYGFVFPCI